MGNFLHFAQLYYNNFFFFNTQIDKAVAKADTPINIKNPQRAAWPGTQVFIPQMLAIRVGIEITNVTDVNNFITLFASFEITEA